MLVFQLLDDQDVQQAFAAYLRRLREQAGWSRDVLAERSCVPAPTITQTIRLATLMIKPARHHPQGGVVGDEPYPRIPGAFFSQYVLPGQYAGDQQDRETDKGAGGGVELVGVTG